MPDPHLELGKLLPQLAELAAATPQLNRCVLGVSAGGLLGERSGLHSTLLLRRLEFEWRFRLARTDQETFLIFFQKESPETVVFDALFRFRLEPEPAPWSGPELLPENVACSLVLPKLIYAHPTAQEWNLFAPSGATAANTILLRVGAGTEGILAVQNADEGPEDARIKLGGNWLAGPPWPVAPFIALAQRMREWVTSSLAQGVRLEFLPPQASDRAEVRQIFYQMLRAACRVMNGLKDQQRQPSDGDLLQPMRTLFGLDGFDSEVTLRLRPDGQMAETMDEEMIELAVQAHMVPADTGLAATVFLKPPDFLVGGELHGELLSGFVEGADWDELAEGLVIQETAARQFLQSLGSGASIFRVKRRGQIDTDVLVAGGTLRGRSVALMLRGDFHVRTDGGEWHVKRKSSIKTLYAGDAHAEVRALEDKDVRYFLAVIASLHKLMLLLS